jgi:hypothetical protein
VINIHAWHERHPKPLSVKPAGKGIALYTAKPDDAIEWQPDAYDPFNFTSDVKVGPLKLHRKVYSLDKVKEVVQQKCAEHLRYQLDF